jgi:hypothetical protein
LDRRSCQIYADPWAVQNLNIVRQYYRLDENSEGFTALWMEMILEGKA